jgi:hypothetical protein
MDDRKNYQKTDELQADDELSPRPLQKIQSGRQPPRQHEEPLPKGSDVPPRPATSE